MKTALISDLHGNHVALRAVLAHAQDARVDRIVCLGDVATLGPEPHRVLETLAELGCPCIMGNHDEFMLDAELIRRLKKANAPPPIFGFGISESQHVTDAIEVGAAGIICGSAVISRISKGGDVTAFIGKLKDSTRNESATQ